MISLPAAIVLAAGRSPLDEGFAQVWKWMEANGTIVYPAIALVIIGLIAGALFASWRADELAGEERGELKLRILQVIRRRISGVSADQVAAELQIETILAAKLLDELEKDGTVSASRGGSFVQYRIRGHS